MSKKLCILISFVLVLSLAGNVLGYETLIWDNDMGDGNRMWDTSANWTWTAGGEPKRAPIAGDWVLLDNWADPCHGPIIDADTNATCAWIDIGGYTTIPMTEVILTMTDGMITGCSWLAAGYYNPGTFRFDLSGGTVNLGSGGFTVGWVTDSHATFNMRGGTFNCTNYLSIGTGYNSSSGDMNMTSGDVNLAGWFQIGCADPCDGTGHVDMHGGTVRTALLAMGGGGVGTMDFAGGTLIIDGDYRIPNDWLFDPCSDTPTDDEPPLYTGTIALLAQKRGLITAYGTKVGEIITDSNYPVGQRAVINLDYGVANPGKTTLTAGAVDPNLAYNPDPLFGSGGLKATDVNLLSWSAGENAVFLHDVYFGTDFAEVNEASDPNTLPGRGRQALADVNHPVDVTWNTTYHWRIDEVNASGVPEWEGTVWNFVTRPAWATNPKPTGTDVSPFATILTWDAGPEANDVNGHHVYFSTDFNDVNERDPCVMTVVSDACFIPGALAFSTQYHWAVDEVNSNEDPNIWPSLNWSFTTTDHLIVENFNSYVDHPDMRAVWRDYYAENDTGCQLFVEKDANFVRDGNSMKYTYKNLTKYGTPKEYGSETEADIANLESESGLDWNFGGAKALSLYFYGDTGNSPTANDQMYVALEDAGNNIGLVKYDPCHGYDMNNIKEESWHRWNISLKDPNFIAGASPAAVDMNNVTKIYIGFGGVRVLGASLIGSNGTVYFEDIELYPPRCRSGLVETDITGDCNTNYEDVDIMARDWLMYDYNVPALEITSGPNLIGWWKFDEGVDATASDSAGDNDGTITHASWTTVGYPNDTADPNHALKFDADAVAEYDRVVCAERTGSNPGTYPDELMPSRFTVSCWVKLDSFGTYSTFVCAGRDDDGMDQSGFYLYNAGWSGTDNFCLGIRIEDDMYSVETTSTYETDTWYHLAATYDDANMVYIYVDGELAPCELRMGLAGVKEGPTDVGGPIRWVSKDSNSYPDSFLIGALPNPPGLADWYYAQATIDDVRLYDYALSYGQIVTLAEQGPVLYHDLISVANIYDLEEKLSKKVNFRDYTILADYWLEGPVLWPW